MPVESYNNELCFQTKFFKVSKKVKFMTTAKNIKYGDNDVIGLGVHAISK